MSGWDTLSTVLNGLGITQTDIAKQLRRQKESERERQAQREVAEAVVGFQNMNEDYRSDPVLREKTQRNLLSHYSPEAGASMLKEFKRLNTDKALRDMAMGSANQRLGEGATRKSNAESDLRAFKSALGSSLANPVDIVEATSKLRPTLEEISEDSTYNGAAVEAQRRALNSVLKGANGVEATVKALDKDNMTPGQGFNLQAYTTNAGKALDGGMKRLPNGDTAMVDANGQPTRVISREPKAQGGNSLTPSETRNAEKNAVGYVDNHYATRLLSLADEFGADKHALNFLSEVDDKGSVSLPRLISSLQNLAKNSEQRSRIQELVEKREKALEALPGLVAKKVSPLTAARQARTKASEEWRKKQEERVETDPLFEATPTKRKAQKGGKEKRIPIINIWGGDEDLDT